MRKAVLAGMIGVLALCGAAQAAAPAGSNLPPPADLAEARALYKALVETNTTHAMGSTKAAELLRDKLLAAGFAPADLSFVAPADKPTKGSLLVRYHGKGKAKPILFMGHLDVVEAKREDWSVDPFVLTEKDGYFYGRGTIDMKDGDAALASALMRLKRQRYVPDRDIIVMFSADEEAGGDANGPAFLLKEHRDLIDAAVAYNLDGGGGSTKGGKRLYYDIGTSEKTYVTFTIEATGPGGHGSVPGSDNPIYRIADGLGRLEAFRFPVMLNATTRAGFKTLAAFETGPDGADMLAVAGSTPDLAAADRLSRIPYRNALLRTTCVATLISGGHAENALPQRARATIQCRMLPGDSADNVQATLVRVLADPKISVTLDAPPIVSPESPPSADMLRRVGGVVHSMWPGVPLVPSMSTGFSDGRQTRNAGIPTYDVGGMWSEQGENRAHGRDERVKVEAFDESVEYTYRLVQAVASTH